MKKLSFRVEYEDDSPHTIIASSSDLFYYYGLYLNYFMGNTFDFIKGVIFKIKFNINKRHLSENQLSSFKIKNKKNFSKYLNIKLYEENN